MKMAKKHKRVFPPPPYFSLYSVTESIVTGLLYHMKTETEPSPRNIVIQIKDRTIDSVQNNNPYINVSSSQTLIFHIYNYSWKILDICL
jgi:hypothetical protein